MIGMSCTHFGCRPIEEWIGRVSDSFGHWEIFSEAEHRIVGREAELSALLDSYGLSCSVHAPICDLNIGSLSDRLREASLQETLDVMESSAGIGAKTVTVHPGLASMAVNGMEEKASERARESIRIIDKAASELSMTVAIENMPDLPFFLGRTAKALASLVDSTDLGICFDIGHANTTGQIDEMIDVFGDRISNIHIHDNNGVRDEHLTIGDGDIDFQYVLGRLSGYKGNYIIEAKSLDSAVESNQRLKMLLS